MTTEVKVYPLKLVESEERLSARLTGWIRTIYRWFRRKEGKIWNNKKW
jgi:hypothetical protein